MNILTADTITKSYQEKKLFSETSFFLQEGEKVGIIGINGTGKSTLLKMLAGLEEPDEGSIIRANHVFIRYLPQTPDIRPEMTVLEAAVADSRSRQNEWSIESAAKAMLAEVEMTEFDKPCGQLSGGQKKKLALVSVLLERAEVLILDEPTNHLDHKTADWLEEKLKGYRGAVIMVTHDRYFLDSVTSRIVEIDKGKIYSYDAGYSGFLELKAAREEMEDASERKRLAILKVELEWVKRGARARSTKQKAHLQRVEKMAEQSAPLRDKKVELDSAASRLGRTTVELEDISKSFGGRRLFEPFSYIFLKNDRIGFVGENGCGKTTLMKLISGACQPDTGSLVTGPTVKIGYFMQEITVMDEAVRVIDYVREGAEYIQTSEGSVSASKMLERFLFTPDMQYNTVAKLSGGEKRRLYLLRILMEAPNVLLLDEPTNDLDITTLTVLEDYLDRFPGIVAVVSHDRYFLDRTVRRIFAFEDGRIRQYEGGYTDYRAKREEQQENEPEKNPGGRQSLERSADKQSTAGWKENRPKKLKFTFQEQKEYESIEGQIRELEEKRGGLDEKMAQHTSDFAKLNELHKEKEETEKLLEEKMEKWMYLEELADKIRKGEE